MARLDSVADGSVAHEDEHVRTYRANLPPHVKEMLVLQENSDRSLNLHRSSRPIGSLKLPDIQNAVDYSKKSPPWLKPKDEPATITGRLLQVSRPSQTKFAKIKKLIMPNVVEAPRKLSKRRRELVELLAKNVYGKIAFVPLPYEYRGLPMYVVARLETACASARFELPLDLKRLEKMTQLEYLAGYTRLHKEQKERYEKFFRRCKKSNPELITFQNMFSSLNMLFGGYLSMSNFEILSLALFLYEQIGFDQTTFVGICTFCDRLYWTSYLEGNDTFNYWGPNRSALEVIDFSNLSWKLQGINISKELRSLLFSLA